MAYITDISAHWILDSRGYPTVSCIVEVESNGKRGVGYASVPSGASTGVHEALELRDGGEEFGGKGVIRAVTNIQTIIKDVLTTQQFSNSIEVDEVLLKIDKTENKSMLGANSVLAVSIASCRAFASLQGLDVWQYLRRLYFGFLPNHTTFPRLMLNIINGGKHADNPIDVQEFMIVPKQSSVREALEIGTTVYHTLKKNLLNSSYSTGVGDEGGFAPALTSSRDALRFLRDSIHKSGYADESVDIALDVASSELYSKTQKTYSLDSKEFDASELIRYYNDLTDEFGIISIEDGMAEDDLDGWRKITDQLGYKLKLVGDDLFVTNSRRFNRIGVENHCANSILIKPNQIGTIKETCEVINLAKKVNYSVIISHRSGETSDDFIADLSFASQADFIKAGAPARGERVAKYNRLIEIAQNFDS